ncbi:hypothetical protein [Nonomuraea dietziae]|uniref:hypothetical protein n=1 Tax=Nonomuraea dietziae TaxID=65515 RepID=UPI0031D49E10
MGRQFPPNETISASDEADDQDALLKVLTEMLQEIGAHTGAIYRLSPDGQVLELAMMEGLPREFVQPWERVSLTAPIPVADALRDKRLVWVGSEEDMVRCYPTIAVAPALRVLPRGGPAVHPRGRLRGDVHRLVRLLSSAARPHA